MKGPLLALCLLSAALPAAAQVYFGAEVGPDAFMKQENAKPDVSGEDAFAWAFTAEVSSASLYTVFASTVPEHEVFIYLRQGIYRQELAALFLMSERTGVPFKKLAAELASAGSFSALAAKHKLDAMALFDDAARLKDAVDLHVPLFIAVAASTSAYEAPLSTGAPPEPATK
jgi:hypothetical protein